MSQLRIVALPILFVLIAVATRFISIAGLSSEKYSMILNAYMQTGARTNIFLIQFVSFLVVLGLLTTAKPQQISLFVVAIFFLIVVSAARHAFPLFVISVVGDALVIWWLQAALKRTPNDPT